jgi:hypothetical protein
LRRIGVTAAALLLAVTGCTGSGDPFAHVCTGSDLRFIQDASIDMAALGAWTAEYQAGQAKPEQVAEQAFTAARRVRGLEPKDPSLRTAQQYLDAMFSEYGEAVTLQGKGENAGERMYRAYGLANFARDVMAQAQPALASKGCDVTALL